MLLTRSKAFLQQPRIVEVTEPVAPKPGWGLWTDDYSNLRQVLK